MSILIGNQTEVYIGIFWKKLRGLLQKDSLSIYNSFNFTTILLNMKHLTRLEHLTNTFDTIEKCIKQSMFTMVFKRRYENVKTMYKHFNILSYRKHKVSTGEIHVEAFR